ncbi:formate/nitrite transporter family protein [Chloroflexota bacterium]
MAISPAESLKGFDALMPSEMARKAEEVGIKKANLDFLSLFGLAVLAGAFIALGAVFATISWTTTTATPFPWGWGRVIGGIAFSLGLILIVVGGAELFTGNNLIVMAWASRKLSSWRLLRNWLIVYTGNLVGAVATALFVFMGREFQMANGAVGVTALNIGTAKVNLDFLQAVALGVLCNALVCLAVWLCFSARTTVDKIAAIIFPISAFVAAGFEHCVANMYFVPLAILIKAGAPNTFWQAVGINPTTYKHLTWTSFFLHNLLPVTLGNIIGGVCLVAVVYWLVYLRKDRTNNVPQE